MKTVLITGSTSGIGQALALHLAQNGEKVLICSRSLEKVQQTVEDVKRVGEAQGFQLDLGDLSSVTKFCQTLSVDVDVLVLNAGVNLTGLEFSPQGFEKTFATNHLGHFLLTQMLLKQCKTLKRIVVLSSGTHDPLTQSGVPAPVYDLQHWATPTSWTGSSVYSSSKLANALYGLYLAKQLKIVVTVYDPGFIGDTGLLKHLGVFQPVAKTVINGLIAFKAWIHQVPNQNSTLQRSVPFLAKLATSDEPEFTRTGLYYSIDAQRQPSVDAQDPRKQQELYDFSLKLLNVKGFSP